MIGGVLWTIFFTGLYVAWCMWTDTMNMIALIVITSPIWGAALFGILMGGLKLWCLWEEWSGAVDRGIRERAMQGNEDAAMAEWQGWGRNRAEIRTPPDPLDRFLPEKRERDPDEGLTHAERIARMRDEVHGGGVLRLSCYVS